VSSLRDQLQAIYESQGELTARGVVDVARDPGHPLHARFEWDDSVAGDKYREIQAGELIRSVRVVDKTAEEAPCSVRAFHSVPQGSGRSYKPIEEIMDDPVTREIVLREAEREWHELHRRYQHLAEWLQVVRRDVTD
jgi:hypothetical protein